GKGRDDQRRNTRHRHADPAAAERERIEQGIIGRQIGGQPRGLRIEACWNAAHAAVGPDGEERRRTRGRLGDRHPAGRAGAANRQLRHRRRVGESRLAAPRNGRIGPASGNRRRRRQVERNGLGGKRVRRDQRKRRSNRNSHDRQRLNLSTLARSASSSALSWSTSRALPLAFGSALAFPLKAWAASSNIAMLRFAMSAKTLPPNASRTAFWLRWKASIAASRYCGTKFCIELP